MKHLTNVINWFEIPVSNFDRARNFYCTILNFKMSDAIVGDIRLGFLPYELAPERVGGAICQGDCYVPSERGSLIYLNGGDDLNIILNRVEGAGGTILQTKKLINDDVGYVAFFRDSEGNRIGLHSRH